MARAVTGDADVADGTRQGRAGVAAHPVGEDVGADALAHRLGPVATEPRDAQHREELARASAGRLGGGGGRRVLGEGCGAWRSCVRDR